MRQKTLWYSLAALMLAAGLVLTLLPARLERNLNRVIPHPPYPVSEGAAQLHRQLVVADLHADSTLWARDLLARGTRGQVDLPRLLAGNVALQVFTAVTRSPAGQNYQRNAADARDNITALALVQAWPPRTWTSRTERALYQAQRLSQFAARSGGSLRLVRNQGDLEQLLRRRARGEAVVGGVLGIEGAHALDGELEAVQTLYDAGFRIVGLQHFFDNRLGGSLHGESGAGLTEFGRQAVDAMLARGMILDLAHASPQVVRDVLARGERPPIVSHSGFRGHCDSPRNIDDALMRQVAAAGGLIGVGFWDGAVCDPDPASIAAAIAYGIGLVGAEHVALGSDFDGSVTTALDSSELAAITQALLDQGVSIPDIRNVMGGNILRFLAQQLPRD